MAEKNWAMKLKDKVVKHFDEKKKKEQDFQAYAKEQLAKSAQRSAAKKTADADPIMKGQNRGTKKVISDMKKQGMTDADIAKFMDKKPAKKTK